LLAEGYVCEIEKDAVLKRCYRYSILTLRHPRGKNFTAAFLLESFTHPDLIAQ
jgi:hypothetical protein